MSRSCRQTFVAIHIMLLIQNPQVIYSAATRTDLGAIVSLSNNFLEVI